MTAPPVKDAQVTGSVRIAAATTTATKGSRYRNAPTRDASIAWRPSYQAIYANPEQKTPRKVTPIHPLAESWEIWSRFPPAKKLTEENFGQFWNRFTVIDIAGGQAKSQQFTDLIDNQVKFEAEKPTH